MELQGRMGKLYRFSEWVMRLAYLNLVWLLFVLVGLVVFGIMPATVAMFTITRKWVAGSEDIPVFSTFWRIYRQEWWKSNRLGLLLGVVGYFLYLDLLLLEAYTGTLFTILYYAVLCLLIVYVLVVLYIFPIYVHYDLPILGLVKNALIIGVSFPFHTILMGAGSFVLYLILLQIPGLQLFLSGSVLSLLLMWVASHSFALIPDQK